MTFYNVLANPLAGLPPMAGGVSSVRPDLQQAYKDWYRLIHDVLAGSPAVKGRRGDYLPYPNSDHLSEDEGVRRAAEVRYDGYLKRAQFFNTTARTAAGFTGLVFNKEPDIDLPARYATHETNVNGSGASLQEQATGVVFNLLAYARGFLRVDYGKDYTQADVQSGRAVPRIHFVDAFSLINWRVTVTEDRKVLTLAVVVEHTEVEDPDGYSLTVETKLREYRLLEDSNGGHYLVVKLWGNAPTPERIYYPRKNDGTNFDYIPIFPLGAKENDFSFDAPPLLDLAEVNIGHYVNSADNEESTFMVGQPTYAAVGVNENWLKDHLNGYLEIGSRQIVPLPEKADLKCVQPNPNTLAAASMDRKEKQMVALGAKLIQDRSVARTATEATGDATVDNSILATITRNINRGYRQAYDACGDFCGVWLSPTQGFELNDDFDMATLTPQILQILFNGVKEGTITVEEIRWLLRRSGYAYMADVDFEAALKNGMNKEVRDLTQDKKPSEGDPIPGNGPNEPN